ncbi:hypothetical protein [Membranihabitans marinus]|uniref:hypothetical protein n=1 Tax=Membranihabitans marinus TaxID=1227546 RepID=UPI001F196431|nr:hypothetical protein [Membranihabitans marinus]
MKTILQSILSLSICFLTISNINAHALFIQSQSEAKKGKLLEIQVFYAEAEEGKKEKIEDWWANVADCVLMVTLPNGEEESLELTAMDDVMIADFTPNLDGQYTFWISHTVDKIVGETQYEFNSQFSVVVGKNATTASQPISGITFASIRKKNKPLSLQFSSEKTSGKKVNITVFSPSGWQRSLAVTDLGFYHFIPEWKGDYMIETFEKIKVDEASHKQVVKIYTTTLSI